jgi:hypothetical protein
MRGPGTDADQRLSTTRNAGALRFALEQWAKREKGALACAAGKICCVGHGARFWREWWAMQDSNLRPAD